MEELRAKREEAIYWIEHFEKEGDKESERYWMGYRRGVEMSISVLSSLGYIV